MSAGLFLVVVVVGLVVGTYLRAHKENKNAKTGEHTGRDANEGGGVLKKQQPRSGRTDVGQAETDTADELVWKDSNRAGDNRTGRLGPLNVAEQMKKPEITHKEVLNNLKIDTWHDQGEYFVLTCIVLDQTVVTSYDDGTQLLTGRHDAPEVVIRYNYEEEQRDIAAVILDAAVEDGGEATMRYEQVRGGDIEAGGTSDPGGDVQNVSFKLVTAVGELWYPR